MTRRIVGTPASGFLTQPDIQKEQAESIYGASIPQEVWERVNVLFSDYGVRLNSLAALPHDNVNRNDPRSYGIGRQKAEKTLAAALALIREVSSDQQLCRAASQTYSMRRDGLPDSWKISKLLETATMAVLDAQLRFRYAANPEITSSDSDASARRDLAKQIVNAFRQAGLDVRLTGWREQNFTDGMSESDMTPIEQLISRLGVHDAATPSAFVRWMRDAIGE